MLLERSSASVDRTLEGEEEEEDEEEENLRCREREIPQLGILIGKGHNQFYL